MFPNVLFIYLFSTCTLMFYLFVFNMFPNVLFIYLFSTCPLMFYSPDSAGVVLCFRLVVQWSEEERRGHDPLIDIYKWVVARSPRNPFQTTITETWKCSQFRPYKTPPRYKPLQTFIVHAIRIAQLHSHVIRAKRNKWNDRKFRRAEQRWRRISWTPRPEKIPWVL